MPKENNILKIINSKPVNKSATTALALIMSISAFSSALASDDQNITKLPTVTVKDKKDKTENKTYQSGTTNIGKTSQAAKDIPQSLTTVTRDLMDDRGAHSLQDALRNVAGLTFNAGEGGRIGDNITIRGFGASSDLYLDGVRDNAQYNRDTFNLERIEVLRGPSSMLFGRGSTGGVVNQVSKEPELGKTSKVDFTAGSHSYFRETADVNHETGESSAFRINVMKTNANSNRDFVSQDSFGIAPSFKFGIDTNDEFLLAYSHLQYDNVPDFGIPIVNAAGGKPINVPNDKFYGLANDYQKDSADNYTGKWTHKFDDKNQLQTILRHSDVSRDLRATGPSVNVAQTVITRGRQSRGAHEQTSTLQSNYTSKFEVLTMKHETLLGAEYLYETADRWNYFGRSGSGAISNPTTNPFNPNPYDPLPANYGATYAHVDPQNFKDTNLGLYAQDIVEFVPHWKLLLGGRHDDFNANYRSLTSSTGNVTEYTRNDNVFSYRTGLMYQPSDYSTYYLSYGTAFNPSGDLYSIEALTASTAAKTDPEKSINTELGAKWELFDGDLSLRTALFRSEKTNERNTDQAMTDVVLLSGKRHTDGVEFEGSGKLTNNWQLFGAVAFMRSKIDNHVNSNAEGLTPPNTPTVSGNFWNIYKINDNWRIGGGVDFVGERTGYSVPTNINTKPTVRRIPGYYRVDSMVEWSKEQYTVKLNIFNLLDKEYYDSIYPNGGWAVPGVDRSAQITVSYKF